MGFAEDFGQNQSRKIFVTRFPFDLPANLSQLTGPGGGGHIGQHWLASSSKGNPITDVFLVLHHSKYKKGFRLRTFWFRLKSTGANCEQQRGFFYL